MAISQINRFWLGKWKARKPAPELPARPRLGTWHLAAGLAFCLLLCCVHSAYLSLAAWLLCLEPGPAPRGPEPEDPGVASARTLAAVYLIDQKLERAEEHFDI
jgi:hypothetical protein